MGPSRFQRFEHHAVVEIGDGDRQRISQCRVGFADFVDCPCNFGGLPYDERFGELRAYGLGSARNPGERSIPDGVSD